MKAQDPRLKAIGAILYDAFVKSEGISIKDASGVIETFETMVNGRMLDCKFSKIIQGGKWVGDCYDCFSLVDSSRIVIHYLGDGRWNLTHRKPGESKSIRIGEVDLDRVSQIFGVGGNHVVGSGIQT